MDCEILASPTAWDDPQGLQGWCFPIVVPLDGGGDREFGYRLEHAGLRPQIIRYSTICLHLDHPRGYKDAKVRQKNLRLIEESQKEARVQTPVGIAQH